MTAPADPELVSLRDYERASAERLDERARAWIDGGAADEVTLADNVAAWQRLALAPRVFAAADPDPEVVVLGRPRPHPVIVAPTAFVALADPGAEPAIARAAEATGTTMCLSTLASVSPAALAAAVPGVPRWFQLYVFRDRAVTESLIAEAEAHGYEALVVTADRPVLGVRDRESRHRVRAAQAPQPGTIGGSEPDDTGSRIDPAVTWADIGAFAADSTLPVIVKGILTAADARLAVEHGASGVIVSNHGGRQLDTTLAGPDALPAIADAVGDTIDVLVDGGVRRGTDVVKAMALGARAVLIGRPVLWGLAVDGAAGVQRVIELLLAEFRTALTLAGAPRAAAVDPGLVVKAPWPRP
jgi:isopentenyl diphosphate isomerase/L-lactate dehydrogenase-like FMN-dependent dehydrogenase